MQHSRHFCYHYTPATRLGCDLLFFVEYLYISSRVFGTRPEGPCLCLRFSMSTMQLLTSCPGFTSTFLNVDPAGGKELNNLVAPVFVSCFEERGDKR